MSLRPVFALQIQELHDQLVGVAVVDLPLKEDDPVFQQQVAKRQMRMTLIIASLPRINQRG